MNRPIERRNRIVRALIVSTMFLATMAGAIAQTVQMSIVNKCNTTIYPGITAGNYPNTNWTLAPGASVNINVPSNLSAARVWARKNCNTVVNPWQCDADQGNTTLVEFTLSGQPGGIDWYDISDVDAYSFPVTLTSSAGTSVTAINDVLQACPAELQVKNAVGTVISCENPCNYYKSSLVCQSILSPQNTRDVVNEWPAPAQQYVNLIHNYAGETYAYPYDDWWGLHTVATGANWTITFCPNGINPTPGNNAAPFPLAPYNVQGSSSGTTATLTWQASAGATSYNVYRSTTEGSSSAIPEDPPIATVTTNSFNDSGLVTGTKYYYIVTAVNASGFSAPSAELWLTAGGGAGQTIPKALGAVTATGGSGQVTLTWPSSSGATSYDIYPTLQSQGEAQYGLTSTPGDSQIALSWSTISGATSYNVYRGTTAGAETQIASNITNLYYMDGGLTNGTTYYYKVAPVSSSGVVGTMTNETATVPVSGAGTPLLHANPWVYSSTSTSFTHTGLTNGQTYYYIVLPHNAVGQGGGSNEINATPSTTVYPAGDLTINCGGGVVTPWIADTDFSGGAASQSNNPINLAGVTNPAPGAVYQSSRYGNSTYTIPGLTAGASYTVRLHFAETFHNGPGQRTFNVLINGSQVLTNFDIYATAGGQNKATVQQFITTANSSGQIVIQFVTVADNAQSNGIEVYPNSPTVPAAPTGLNATAADGQVSLSWLASAGATSYNVYRSTTSGAETLLTSGITSTSYTNTGLTNGTTYYYKVAAVNSVGTSPLSGEVSSTPQSAPASPNNLVATAGNGQVALSWSTVSSATSYNLYRSTTSGAETLLTSGLTGTSYTDTGLTNGTTYYYKLAAVNSFGTSGLSNEVSATPQSVTGTGGISINCGGAAAGSFVADVDFTGGTATTFAATVDTSLLTGSIPPQPVLQSNRFGTCTYTILGLTANATYPVTLYFSEGYWTAAGKRVFNVVANGTTVLTNFDIFAAAGAANKAVQRSFNVNANANGQIVLNFNTVVDNAQVNAIVVGNGGSGGTLPGAPGTLSATAGNTQVTLNWGAASGATSYNLYRSTTPGGEGATPYKTNVTSPTTDTGLSNCTTYYYMVAGVNATGVGPMSNEASPTPTGGVPSAPVGLTATPSSGQVALSWSTLAGAQTYNVYRGTTAGGESATPIVTGLTAPNYANTGLTNGTTYFYKVAGVNCSGTSAMSSEVSATPTGGTTLSINCGGAATGSWVADTDFSGGGVVTWTNAVDTSLLTGTIPPQAVLQDDREGIFTYTIPGYTTGSSHTVTMYFVEQYWNAAGKRVFSVASNGTTVISNLDVFATAGAQMKAIQKTFTTNANSSGQIVLTFSATADQPKIGGIVVQ